MIRKVNKTPAACIQLLSYALIITTVLIPAIAAAQAADQNPGARLTTGRLASIAVLIIGIVGLIAGYSAKKQPANTLKSKTGSFIALALGGLCIIFSAIRLANTTGFGTGGGKAGAIVAMLVGVIAVALAITPFYRQQNTKSN